MCKHEKALFPSADHGAALRRGAGGDGCPDPHARHHRRRRDRNGQRDALHLRLRLHHLADGRLVVAGGDRRDSGRRNGHRRKPPPPTQRPAADETAAGETATDETTAADETAAGETAADDSAAATDETAADDGTWLGEESLNYAPDVYAPLDNADVSLTVQPASGLTADDADDMLAEASYTEDTEAVVGEIETFAMENGAEAKSIEVVSGGVCYRYYFISGDSFSLCVTAQCPEEAVEGYGARMAEMVASIDFAA